MHGSLVRLGPRAPVHKASRSPGAPATRRESCLPFGLSVSSCYAWSGFPTRSIVLFLEVRAGPEWLGEVFGIDNLGNHQQDCIAARQIKSVEVFCQYSAGAVRHAILAQISRP